MPKAVPNLILSVRMERVSAYVRDADGGGGLFQKLGEGWRYPTVG